MVSRYIPWRSISWLFEIAFLLLLSMLFIVMWSRLIGPTKSSTITKIRSPIFVPVKDKPFFFTFDTLPEIENCEKLRALGVVQSAPANFGIRHTIRQTWGSSTNVTSLKVAFYVNNLPKEDARLVFLLGQTENKNINKDVEKEAREYNDIIRYDMFDGYTSLVFKSLIMAAFFRRECPAEILIKIDEDVIFHIDRFLSLLDEKVSLTNSTSFIAGVILNSSEVVRNTGNKWYVPHDAFPGKYFPTHAKGLAYAMSRKAVGEIMKNLPKQNYFAVEDAYLTGMLAIGTDVTFLQLYSPNRVGFHSGKVPPNARCLNGQPTVFAVHGFKTGRWIKHGWKEFLKQNKKCQN